MTPASTISAAPAASQSGIAEEIPILDDPVTPEGYLSPEGLGSLEWTLIIAGIILLAGLISWWIVMRKKPTTPPPTAAEKALAEVDELETYKPSLKECALKLSLILRRYISGNTADPALYETHQEFNLRADSLSALPETLQNYTRQLLDYMAALKYEANTPQDEAIAQQIINDTKKLIGDIDRASAPHDDVTTPQEPKRNHAR